MDIRVENIRNPKNSTWLRGTIRLGWTPKAREAFFAIWDEDSSGQSSQIAVNIFGAFVITCDIKRKSLAWQYPKVQLVEEG